VDGVAEVGPEVDPHAEEVETEEADLAVKLSTINQPTENTAHRKRRNGPWKLITSHPAAVGRI